ncbi:MAG: hypothetical protein ACI906_001378 [Candidatus Latescibacterota bacterium]
MNLETLYQQTIARLPAERRKIMQDLISEFGPGETACLLLALTAGTSQRERQLVRLLMTDIEKMEVLKTGENE